MNNIIPTKQKILICAVNLFASKGCIETSVRDIATTVGIKPASIYNHFASKEDILLLMLDDYANKTKIIVNKPDTCLVFFRDYNTKNCLERRLLV